MGKTPRESNDKFMPVLTDADVGLAKEFSDADVGLGPKTFSDADVGLTAPAKQTPKPFQVPQPLVGSEIFAPPVDKGMNIAPGETPLTVLPWNKVPLADTIHALSTTANEPTKAIAEQFSNRPEKSLLGLPEPERVVPNPESPAWLGIPSASVVKAGLGLGHFMSSPKGLIEMTAAATPAAPVVIGKWTLDMLDGLIQSVKAGKEAWEKGDKQGVSDAAANTALFATGIHGAAKALGGEGPRARIAPERAEGVSGQGEPIKIAPEPVSATPQAEIKPSEPTQSVPEIPSEPLMTAGEWLKTLEESMKKGQIVKSVEARQPEQPVIPPTAEVKPVETPPATPSEVVEKAIQEQPLTLPTAETVNKPDVFDRIETEVKPAATMAEKENAARRIALTLAQTDDAGGEVGLTIDHYVENGTLTPEEGRVIEQKIKSGEFRSELSPDEFRYMLQNPEAAPKPPEAAPAREVKAGFVPPRAEIRKPIQGPTGAKIIGYEWRSKMGEKWSEREGGYVEARVSDWDQSDTSQGTGRDIVHVFYVEHPGGKMTTEGIRSAQNVLGISESRLMTIAKNERSAQEYRKQQEDLHAKVYDENASATPSEAAQKYRKNNHSPLRSFEENNQIFRESVLIEKDGKYNRTTPKNADFLSRYGWKVSEFDPAKQTKPPQAETGVEAPGTRETLPGGETVTPPVTEQRGVKPEEIERTQNEIRPNEMESSARSGEGKPGVVGQEARGDNELESRADAATKRTDDAYSKLQTLRNQANAAGYGTKRKAELERRVERAQHEYDAASKESEPLRQQRYDRTLERVAREGPPEAQTAARVELMQRRKDPRFREESDKAYQALKEDAKKRLMDRGVDEKTAAHESLQLASSVMSYPASEFGYFESRIPNVIERLKEESASEQRQAKGKALLEEYEVLADTRFEGRVRGARTQADFEQLMDEKRAELENEKAAQKESDRIQAEKLKEDIAAERERAKELQSQGKLAWRWGMEPARWNPVEGKPIKVPFVPDHEFYVYRSTEGKNKGRWVINETKSGLSVGFGKSRAEAMADFKTKYDTLGSEKFNEAVRRASKDHPPKPDLSQPAETPVEERGPGGGNVSTFGLFDPAAYRPAVEYGKYLYGKTKDFGRWSAQMVRRFGDSIRDHLRTMFDYLYFSDSKYISEVGRRYERISGEYNTKESWTALKNYRDELINDALDDPQISKWVSEKRFGDVSGKDAVDLALHNERPGLAYQDLRQYLERVHTDLWETNERMEDIRTQDAENNYKSSAAAKGFVLQKLMDDHGYDAPGALELLDNWKQDGVRDVREVDPALAQFADALVFEHAGDQHLKDVVERGLYSVPPERQSLSTRMAEGFENARKERQERIAQRGSAGGNLSAWGPFDPANYRPATEWTRKFWRAFAMHSLPKITESNRAAGEAGARYGSAQATGRRKGQLFADRVTEGLGDKEFDFKFGTALVEDNLRSIRKDFEDNGDMEAAGKVGSVIGKANSPFKTESEYQNFLKDPETQEAVRRHELAWEAVKEPMFRQANDIDPDAALPTRGLQTGARINLKGLTEKEMPPGRSRGTIRATATLLRRDPFAIPAAGDAIYEGSYREMMANSFERELPVATQHDFVAKLVKGGDAVITPTERPAKRIRLKNEDVQSYPISLRPWTGKFLQIRKSLAHEYEAVTGLKPETRIPLFSPVADFLTRQSIMGLAEGSTHVSNLLMDVFTGVGPTGNPVINTLLKAGWRSDVLLRLPQVLIKAFGNREADMLRLVEMGAAKEPYGGKIGFLINKIDQGIRLNASEVYKAMAENGWVEKSETGEREFVNAAAGQYNKRLQPLAIRMLRSTGFQPFATAAHTFNVKGLRELGLGPAAKATGNLSALALRAEKAAGLIGIGVVLATIQQMLTGSPNPPAGTPIGAVGWIGDDKRLHYFNVGALTGVTRGLRVTGIGPMLEAKRAGLTPDQQLSRGVEALANTALSYVGGPAVQFAVKSATGKRPGVPMTQEAPVVPPNNNGTLLQTQIAKNIETAARQANPAVDSAISVMEGKPWDEIAQRQFSRYTPRTGMSQETIEALPKIVRGGQIHDYVDALARQARKLPISQRASFINQHLRDDKVAPEDATKVLRELKIKGVYKYQ